MLVRAVEDNPKVVPGPARSEAHRDASSGRRRERRLPNGAASRSLHREWRNGAQSLHSSCVQPSSATSTPAARAPVKSPGRPSSARIAPSGHDTDSDAAADADFGRFRWPPLLGTSSRCHRVRTDEERAPASLGKNLSIPSLDGNSLEHAPFVETRSRKTNGIRRKYRNGNSRTRIRLRGGRAAALDCSVLLLEDWSVWNKRSKRAAYVFEPERADHEVAHQSHQLSRQDQVDAYEDWQAEWLRRPWRGPARRIRRDGWRRHALIAKPSPARRETHASFANYAEIERDAARP